MALNGVGLMFNGQGGMRNLTGQMLPTLDPKFEPSTATAEMFHLDSFREMRFRFSGAMPSIVNEHTSASPGTPPNG